jgi:hypothetical protein
LRPAAQAGAEACFLGLFGTRKEGYILAARTTRGTGWPAINAGRRDGEDEHSVVTGIARRYALPALIFVSMIVTWVLFDLTAVVELGRVGDR